MLWDFLYHYPNPVSLKHGTTLSMAFKSTLDSHNGTHKVGVSHLLHYLMEHVNIDQSSGKLACKLQ